MLQVLWVYFFTYFNISLQLTECTIWHFVIIIGCFLHHTFAFFVCWLGVWLAGWLAAVLWTNQKFHIEAAHHWVKRQPFHCCWNFIEFRRCRRCRRRWLALKQRQQCLLPRVETNQPASHCQVESLCFSHDKGALMLRPCQVYTRKMQKNEKEKPKMKAAKLCHHSLVPEWPFFDLLANANGNFVKLF